MSFLTIKVIFARKKNKAGAAIEKIKRENVYKGRSPGLSTP